MLATAIGASNILIFNATLTLTSNQKEIQNTNTECVHSTAQHNTTQHKTVRKARSAVEPVTAADQWLNLFFKSFGLVEGF
ncbi:hypothetical protein VNO78_17514 [Psophocarpus tetragonolobus]|uniref:Uncharacterized protein n=1 Tax=Psophocarpus tetragonolobus TaxID=3891 RepID=A0AAN9XLE9_PSOTE